MPIDSKQYVAADPVVIVSDITVRLYSATEIHALQRNESSKALVEIVEWCENFLGRPDKMLGRSGNVCPFVPEAMTRGSLKFAIIRAKAQGIAMAAEIEETVAQLRDRFLAEEEAEGKINIFSSWVMIFPHIAQAEFAEAIDAPQKRMKPSFVRRGLMLGEFYPTCPSPGIRNSSFRPLQSPIPLLVIRHMVESDIEFLSRPLDPLPVRIESLRAYLQFLGTSLSILSQNRAREALLRAETEAAHFVMSNELSSSEGWFSEVTNPPAGDPPSPKCMRFAPLVKGDGAICPPIPELLLAQPPESLIGSHSETGL